LVAAILGAIAAQAAADESVFQFSRPLSLPALEAEELVSVPLDSDVFAATRREPLGRMTDPGLPDVRIFDASGNEVSYLLRKASTTREETVRKSWRAVRPTVRVAGATGLEIIVELDKDDPLPGGVRIVSPLQNFEHRVQVFASADGKDWQPISEDGLIFDYSQYMDVRSDTVPADAGQLRHFRIVIDDVTAEQQSQLLELTRRLRGDEETEREERFFLQRRPFRIDRLEFWRDDRVERTTGDKKVEYPVTVADIKNLSEEAQTVVAIESSREPLTSLKLKTAARNFSRRAHVQVEDARGTQQRWRTIGEGTVSRLDFRNLDREELAVFFPESRESQYRLVIENRNSPPLEVNGIEAEGNAYELVFLADPQIDYRLAYGDAEAKPPSYDVAAVRASLDAGYQPVLASLGEPTESPGAAAEGGWTWSGLVSDPWLLGCVIVLLVVALGWALYGASRRLGSIPDDADQ